jgi:hypothetical protein
MPIILASKPRVYQLFRLKEFKDLITTLKSYNERKEIG